MPAKQYRLLADHFSYFRKGHLYGKKGEIVTVITHNPDMCIVESKAGDRYPIRTEQLAEIIITNNS